MSASTAFDAAAPTFERHRALPQEVAPAIRAAILAADGVPPRPRLLDLGAGTGRIGWPFVAAGDDYVGVDLALGMLGEFIGRHGAGPRTPRLVQADGRLLPFRDATFDVVAMIQVFGGNPDWHPLVAEARRVLRPGGSLVVGRTAAPHDGLDARMKRRLASILGEHAAAPQQTNEVRRWLRSQARRSWTVTAATWATERTPRGFIDRHRTGARFSALASARKERALAELAAWAAETFGSLDTAVGETHAFELSTFGFEEG
jgi:ubiquinone/menaquinone biosynthesis C-methylase UbiE